jgi:hypothetical protein
MVSRVPHAFLKQRSLQPAAAHLGNRSGAAFTGYLLRNGRETKGAIETTAPDPDCRRPYPKTTDSANRSFCQFDSAAGANWMHSEHVGATNTGGFSRFASPGKLAGVCTS